MNIDDLKFGSRITDGLDAAILVCIDGGSYCFWVYRKDFSVLFKSQLSRRDLQLDLQSTWYKLLPPLVQKQWTRTPPDHPCLCMIRPGVDAKDTGTPALIRNGTRAEGWQGYLMIDSAAFGTWRCEDEIEEISEAEFQFAELVEP